MEILYTDGQIIVCVKPVGMDSEQAFPCALQTQLGGEIFPLHRLDKNVGGVMIYARTKKAAGELSEIIRNGQMVKEYVALVHGKPPPEGDWQDLLFKDSRKNKSFVVKKLRAGIKLARLTYRTLRAGEQTLVHIRLYTGRSHQIRVQFSSRGYPLVGDHKYGSRSQETEPKLFSCRITFPYRGQEMVFGQMPEWAKEE